MLEARRFKRRVLSGPTDPQHVVSEMRAGATLVFQATSTYCPEVASFCAELADDIGCPVAANAFLTPPHAQGAPVHYDMASVFIRQLAGSKTWRPHEPPKQWPIKRSKPGDKPETPLSQEVVPHPGDCLYLPRGYYHEGITGDDGSVHITFSDGVEDHWADVLHAVLFPVKSLCSGPGSRRRWPLGDLSPRHSGSGHARCNS
ncbi:JmjC domain-containing protein [Streptomyces xanthochromogenes]|uniref:JmjC domain-containing protein n=1 Tax=Streptomyces xanthochromogenes TaxID=67384 RepID=UPI0037A9395A